MDNFISTGVRLILAVVKIVYYIACCVLTDVKAVKYIVDVSLNMRKMGNLRRVYGKSAHCKAA